ncbi:MAG: class I SAM-dependent methyltransferase [Bryobacteraceae bacterium]
MNRPGPTTSVASLLRDEIARKGPVRFSRFMEVALYHPEVGYYRCGRDPFGKGGDYFTAEQLQPVFGILIAAILRRLRHRMGEPADFTVVELGAGRMEMAEALREFRYFPVESGRAEWPDRFRGVVFSNEFFDALPVDVAVRRGNQFFEMRVDWRGGRFRWTEGPPLSGEHADYAERYLREAAEGAWVEIGLEALRWLERIAERLETGYVFTIDYGYTSRELARFSYGTLMSYRRHTAREDVLLDPGEQDITAHAAFSALQLHGERIGLRTLRFESLAAALAAVGEEDGFAAALNAATEAEQLRRRLQLKTLLFGFGENFRALLQYAPPRN